MAKKTDATIKLGTEGADETRVDIGGVRDSLESYGDAGTKVAQTVTTALERIDAKWKKASTDMASITAKDVNAMVKNFAVLQKAVDSLDGKAPKELTDALAKAEAQVKKVTQEFGELDDAVKDNAANVKLAGDNWPGLTNAMEAAGGTMGTVVAKVGLVTGALKEGWQMGLQFSEWIGTDMSELEKLTDSIAHRIGVIVRSSFDGLVSIANLAMAVMSGNTDEMKRAWKDLQDTGASTFKALGDAVSMSADEFEKAHPKVKKHTEEIEKNTKAAKESVVVYKSTADVQKEVIERQTKLLEQATEFEKKKKAEEEAIRKSTAALMDAEHAIARRTSDMQYFAREVEAGRAAVEAQAAEVAKLTEKYGANDPMTLGAIEKQKQLEAALAKSNEQYKTAEDDVAKYTDIQDKAQSAIDRARENLKKLADEQEKLKKAMSTALEPLIDWTTKAHGAASAGQALADATGKVAAPADQAATAMKKAADSGPGAAKAISDLAAAAAPAADPLAAMATAANRLLDALDGPRLGNAIEKLRMVRDIVKEIRGDAEALEPAFDKAYTAAEKLASLSGGEGEAA